MCTEVSEKTALVRILSDGYVRVCHTTPQQMGSALCHVNNKWSGRAIRFQLSHHDEHRDWHHVTPVFRATVDEKTRDVVLLGLRNDLTEYFSG